MSPPARSARVVSVGEVGVIPADLSAPRGTRGDIDDPSTPGSLERGQECLRQ